MKKKVFIIVFIFILLIIPLFIFNDTKETKKENLHKQTIKSKKKKIFKVESDNINNYIKEEEKEEIKEKIVIEERKIKEVSKKNKFRYDTSKYDNINEYIKEEIKEEERINYICIKEETKEKTKKVIDISSWQGNIDFEKVKNSNLVDEVIVRIGYGTTLNDQPVLDSKFERNISELRRLNIPFGIYIFGYAQNIYASNIEVDFIDNIFKKYNLSKETFIWYDAELTTFNNVYYSKELYKNVVNNFINRLNGLGYNNVGLYGNLYMLTKGSLSFEKNYPIWVAQYNSKCEYPGEYKGWQYTSDGHVDGINGRVDMNFFY